MSHIRMPASHPVQSCACRSRRRRMHAAQPSLGDGGVAVPLHQEAPGKYAGSYVVREGDRIDPMSE